MLRHAAVAGQFYKGSADALRRQVLACIEPGVEKRQVIAALAPHAGLIYSGPVAGAVYSRIIIPRTVILIGPNHTGLGAPLAVMDKGSWETPLGTVPIDELLAASLLKQSHRIQPDSLAHLREHSLEVQLPFLQYFRQDLSIVPIQMLDTRLEACVLLGQAIGTAVRERIHSAGAGENGVLIVASSDMSHYEEASAARVKDQKAIDRVLHLDHEGLYEVVRDQHITMCGYGPTVVMLVAAKMLNAERAELIRYTNSGQVSGDYDQVVGYAGILVF